MLLGTIPELSNQYFMFFGLGFIISAYIVPNFVKTNKCSDNSCGTDVNK
jgi:hypothetical protein